MPKLAFPTPHINATPEQIADTVLMPGDPKRSRLVAKEFLSNAKLFNDVRGVQGYTGEWKGARVSVMASGMGMPSIAIYSYELYNAFDVQSIIRIGSAGSIQPDVAVRDIVIGRGAFTDSTFALQLLGEGCDIALCDNRLLEGAVEIGTESGLSLHVGNILSSDVFYSEEENSYQKWQERGALAVEMEAAALYINAKRANKSALAICTVSNSLLTGEELPAEQRETSFTDMIELALDLACKA